MEIPLGRWSTSAALAQIGTTILFGIMAVGALGYALSVTYVWTTAIIGILMIVMIGLAIYGIKMLPKTKSTKKRKCYNWITVFFLATTTLNIIYWNLFMGWKI